MDEKNLFNLKGKVAIVTGGGRGIGKFIARGLAEAGADLTIASRKLQNCQAAAEDLKRWGVRVLAVPCDLERIEDIENLVEKTMTSYDRVDILVNNAGMTWGAPTLEFPLDKWKKIMDINVLGTFLLSQRVAKIMISAGGGKIINLASVSGLRGTREEIQPAVSYNVSKGALVTMTKDLAVKWAKYNIQVNAIAPGYFATDMNAYLEKESFQDRRARVIEDIPMQRIGGEEDIKGVAVFLASAAANYITGEIICVDGGQTAK